MLALTNTSFAQQGYLSSTGASLFPLALQNTEREIPGTNLAFKIITDPYDLEDAFKHRYEVFCKEKGIANPEDYPHQMESDDYDQFCLHTAITEEDQIVAYTRLVLPCDEFPLERSNILPAVFDRSRSVEVSRALLVKSKRRNPGNIIWHLFNNIYGICQNDDVDAILSFSNTIMYNGYKKRGVPFRYVGDMVEYHGHGSHPLVIDVNQHRTPNFLLH